MASLMDFIFVKTIFITEKNCEGQYGGNIKIVPLKENDKIYEVISDKSNNLFSVKEREIQSFRYLDGGRTNNSEIIFNNNTSIIYNEEKPLGSEGCWYIDKLSAYRRATELSEENISSQKLRLLFSKKQLTKLKKDIKRIEGK